MPQHTAIDCNTQSTFREGHSHMCLRAHVCACSHTYTRTHTHTHTNRHIYVHAYTPTHVHTPTPTHPYTHAHTHIHSCAVHTHARMTTCMRVTRIQSLIFQQGVSRNQQQTHFNTNCKTLQQSLQHNATGMGISTRSYLKPITNTLRYTLQHTATNTATHCNRYGNFNEESVGTNPFTMKYGAVSALRPSTALLLFPFFQLCQVFCTQ